MQLTYILKYHSCYYLDSNLSTAGGGNKESNSRVGENSSLTWACSGEVAEVRQHFLADVLWSL